MPESSELIFDVGWDTVLRLARERFAMMTKEEQDAAIGTDEDFPGFPEQVRQVLESNTDPSSLADGFDAYGFDAYGFYETVDGILYPLNQQLAEIHKRLIAKHWPDTYMGDIGAAKPGGRVPRGVPADDWYNYFCAVTPAGPRAFSLFSIERYADEGSYDVNWGIGLTSRYIPAWIDWRERNGGSGSFKLNKEALAMIEEARDAIAEVLPEIKDADLVNAPNFY